MTSSKANLAQLPGIPEQKTKTLGKKESLNFFSNDVQTKQETPEPTAERSNTAAAEPASVSKEFRENASSKFNTSASRPYSAPALRRPKAQGENNDENVSEIDHASMIEDEDDDDDAESMFQKSNFTIKPEEALLNIKARTMFEMVEEIELPGGGHRKLLFLTNSQASLLANSPHSISKMVEAFEIPPPKLAIKLFQSVGSLEWFGMLKRMGMKGPNVPKYYAGVVADKVPWETWNDAQQAEEKLDCFMRDVLIPLAAETNAVIFMSPVVGSCMLASSFNRMFSVERAKWGGSVPFTTIGCATDMPMLYRTEDNNAFWKQLRNRSRSWQMRHTQLLSACHRYDESQREEWFPVGDLDPNMQNYVVVDTIHRNKVGNKRPANKLMMEFMRHFTSKLPCISIKTGMSSRSDLSGSGAAGLGAVVDAAKSGSPVIFLDMRPRLNPKISHQRQQMREQTHVSPQKRRTLENIEDAWTRESIIENAKEQYKDQCARLSKENVPEVYDVMSLAFFKDVLHGDADGSTNNEDVKSMPIYEAIQMLHDIDKGTKGPKGHHNRTGRATTEQAREVASWLVNGFYEDAWLQISDSRREELASQGIITAGEYYKDLILSMRVHFTMLLESPNFHAVNLADIRGAHQLTRDLVKLDRLPKMNNLEGMRLLQEAWDEYDIAMYLASRYKIWSKFYYALILLCGVGIAIMIDLKTSREPEHDPITLPNITISITQVLFLVSLASSFVVGSEGYMNPTQRWRQLRTSSSLMLSAIWKYRTRVDEFAVSMLNLKAPEEALIHALTRWREDLIAGSDLQVTDLEKSYKASVYRHFQYPSQGLFDPDKYIDDHHSPVKPNKYIDLRLLPAKAFYQARVPAYSRWRFRLQLCVWLATVVGASLSVFKDGQHMVIVSATAAAATSWKEFSDIDRKLARYSGAIRALKNLLSWWTSLSEVEQASTGNISKLVLSGEGIITNEFQAWMSTGGSQAPANKADKQHAPEDDVVVHVK